MDASITQTRIDARSTRSQRFAPAVRSAFLLRVRKNHWGSPYTLVLPNPKAGVSEGDPNHFPELSAIHRRFSSNSIHLETLVPEFVRNGI